MRWIRQRRYRRTCADGLRSKNGAGATFKDSQNEPVVTRKTPLVAPISNRHSTTNRIRPNSLKTNDRQISNRGQNTLKLFDFLPFSPQNFTQLTQRLRIYLGGEQPKYSGGVNSLLSRCFTRASLRSSTR